MAGWKITDYNPTAIRKKTTASIDKEYARMRRNISRRVATFEKHGLGKLSQVKAVKKAMEGNISRRDKEHAIMEMKRFLYLDTSSYTKYAKYRAEQVAYWKSQGVDVTADSYEAWTEFFEWSKSFYKERYEISDIKEKWNKVSKDLEAAVDFFHSRYLNEKELPGTEKKLPGT